MNQLRSRWALVVPAAVLAVGIFAPQPLHAELIEKTTQVGGTTVHYKAVLPDAYEPAKAYPGILVFGGGPQTMNVVDNVLNRNFRAEAEKRGYVIPGYMWQPGTATPRAGPGVSPHATAESAARACAV